MNGSPAAGNVSGPASWQMRPIDRARYFLPAHWNEPDPYVAHLANCSVTTARRARLELERSGAIPQREIGTAEYAGGAARTHQAARLRGGLTASQRAALELEADPAASDARLAERASCSRTVVREARQQLEHDGSIPAVPAAGRERRGKQEPNPVRLWPDWLPAPPAVIYDAGLCASGVYPRHLWGSEDPAERQRAVDICRVCPAQLACREWAIGLPASDKWTVWGGMLPGARARARKGRHRRETAVA